jgi:hypothetical protein
MGQIGVQRCEVEFEPLGPAGPAAGPADAAAGAGADG